jgi:hypothetical protein
MSESFRDKSALVIDNGLFTHCAIKLAESFGKVWYHTPWVNAFPKSNGTLPGDGLDEIKRVNYWEDYVDRADIVVFPDVMFGPLQTLLVRMGKRVWGSRRGERLELDRWWFKKFAKSLNMPVAETHLIIGVDALVRFLKTHKNYWIKTSTYRGDFETFKSKTYEHVKPRLDKLISELGEKGRIYRFIVEKDIPAIVELGYDGPCVDGQFPRVGAFGKEKKDAGYIGIAKAYTSFPEPIKWVNEKLSDYLRQMEYRGFNSSEIRSTREPVTDTQPEQFENFDVIWHLGEKVPNTDFYAYATDPCCRMASPPGEGYIEWFSNWAEIIWHGSEGKVIDPEPIGRYAAEIMLHSSFADQHWQPVVFPEEQRQWVKLRNCCKIEGVYSAVPQAVGLPEIGAVVGIDEDLRTAMKLALERASKVDGYFIETKEDALQCTIAEINNAQDEGIPFTDDSLPTADEIEDMQLCLAEE